jgi:hypothetical protein
LVRLLYRWHSFWIEVHRGQQRKLDGANALAADPVFILGLWRTGTTFLHGLLAEAPGLAAPTTEQCMHAASFRLRGSMRLRTGQAASRPMDSLLVDAGSAQEDEFALLALGIPSVYLAFLDPRRLPSLARWLEPDAWLHGTVPGWDGEWLAFLRDVQAALPAQRARLVLKSPTHSFRVQSIARRFPQSAFIWLVREPREVFFSCRRMWKTMFTRYALWEWSDEVLDDFLLRAFASAGRCLSWAISTQPRDQLAVLDQKDVLRNPRDALDALNRQLHLWSGDSTIRHPEQSVSRSLAHLGPRTYRDEILPDRACSGIDALRTIQERAKASHGA